MLAVRGLVRRPGLELVLLRRRLHGRTGEGYELVVLEVRRRLVHGWASQDDIIRIDDGAQNVQRALREEWEVFQSEARRDAEEVCEGAAVDNTARGDGVEPASNEHRLVLRFGMVGALGREAVRVGLPRGEYWLKGRPALVPVGHPHVDLQGSCA